ncbi:hypothetical protein CONPUDRAFT_163763 [Coniophora puteana RWD-64-598 SS2]|uniref:Matrin-type domain-containing protein n=1 Tax=Coniophora puteana (strain RWD-64-598) TaxID=741705 RepID=A0A5M3MU69_CONPW|nr:uncharacterized protein CONPUDRAFT_163763 [Coniophora puteana RWD-64-598 SS2]EIW82663.1 hypothetical protein CONPUDRAFT_163763 [Coniophora puteana RWD-64-598 SS2]
MSEYWVSKKRYWCKYCDIYIADDAPSRQHHEGGLRHKGNVERFIRNLYKTGEKRKKDADEERREMARIGKAAEAAYAQDVAGGLAKGSSAPGPSASSSAAARKPTKPSNPYADYTTAAQLGYEDPDAARLEAELEQRRTEGIVGTWETVESHSPTPVPAQDAGIAEGDAVMGAADGEGAVAAAGTKREASPPAEEEDERSFKIRKKTTRSGLGEIYDPGMIPVKLKPKKESPPTEPPAAATSATSAPDATIKAEVKAEDAAATAGDGSPKVGKIQWKRAAFTQAAVEPQRYVPLSPEPASDGIKKEEEDEDSNTVVVDGTATTRDTTNGVKKEEEGASPSLALPPAAEEPAPAKNLFRKRKVPAGGAGRRGM